jgi:2-polyprenyl-3-methyl-5-hydroxy-6-metoxy-1,4-benzoquinol methylase
MTTHSPTKLDLASYGADKLGGYYANERADLVSALPRPIGRVLDVGCGEGTAAKSLRDAGAESIVGIEINERVASRARSVLDDLRIGAVEDVLPSLMGPFDTFCCYDVLEHLVDPGIVLQKLRDLAAPKARLQISVPNARHFSLAADLVFRGTFGYAEWGHRDSTHLRWFTKSDIMRLVEKCGWSVVEVAHPELHRSRWLARMTRGRSTEFLVGQWYILATLAT